MTPQEQIEALGQTRESLMGDLNEAFEKNDFTKIVGLVNAIASLEKQAQEIAERAHAGL